MGRGAPTEDHPRSRGVYSSPTRSERSRIGSSPLARGLQGDLPLRLRGDRIIPARAGFTPPHMGRGAPTEDHPRSRGVYTATRRPRVRAWGSSPLARGLPGGGPRGRVPQARVRDHPRSRGVYPEGLRPGLDSRGSSPLARGLPRRAAVGHGGRGIIPARAGFTRAKPAQVVRAGDHPRSRGVYPPTASGSTG